MVNSRDEGASASGELNSGRANEGSDRCGRISKVVSLVVEKYARDARTANKRVTRAAH